jgi:hypothetical protein
MKLVNGDAFRSQFVRRTPRASRSRNPAPPGAECAAEHHGEGREPAPEGVVIFGQITCGFFTLPVRWGSCGAVWGVLL